MYFRGTQVRLVYSNVRVCILCSTTKNNLSFPLVVSYGKAYSNEIKIAKQIINNLDRFWKVAVTSR